MTISTSQIGLNQHIETCGNHYSIQHTRRGDYLVYRFEREAGRYATLESAREAVWNLATVDQQVREENESSLKLQQTFDASVPTLNRLQIAWQNWRKEFYAHLSYESRRVAASQRALDSVPDRLADHSPTFRHHEARYAEEASAIDQRHLEYNSIVALDTAIKNARRAKTADDLFSAITRAVEFTKNHSGYIGAFWLDAINTSEKI